MKHTLAGYEISSPFVNAAGSVTGRHGEVILDQVTALASTDIGAICIGSIPIPAQPGNSALYDGPVYAHDKQSGKTFNSIGLEGMGLTAAKVLIPKIIEIAHDKGKPVIVSVSPTRPTKEIGTILQQAYRLVAEMQETGADMIEINTSCRHVGEAGKQLLGHDTDGMYNLVDDLESLVSNTGNKLGVKLPAYQTAAELLTANELTDLFLDRRIFDYIVTSNSLPLDQTSVTPLAHIPREAQSMSGPAAKSVGREQLRYWVSKLAGRIDIVSNLGIDSGTELAIRIKMGASAGGGATSFRESTDFTATANQLLNEYANAEKHEFDQLIVV